MAKNVGLNKAGRAKKDEFYTDYDVIQSELNYYEGQFEGKVVLCNCDDPFESNFAKFFLRNFNYLKLKRLICTSYAGSPMAGTQLSLFDDYNEPVTNEHGYVLDISEVPMSNGRGVNDMDIQTLLHSKGVVKRLKGNGDYASDECLNYLKQSDIVVTNPPFSKFRPYLATLMEYHKKFLIIGNVNALTYKEVFPLIKNNEVWLGASIHSGDREFRVPDNYPLKASGYRVDAEGRKYIRVKGVRWFTNLDYQQRHEDLVLYKQYRSDDYPKFDNYDAIDVDKTADIPLDYSGYMGVPITFLDKFSPDQFDIVNANDVRTANDGKKSLGLIKNADGAITINGRTRRTYARIVIKNKKVQYIED